MKLSSRFASATGILLFLVLAGAGRAQEPDTLAPTTVDASALDPAPIGTLADLLTGRVPGLVVQDVSGTVGTSQRIRIRGIRSLDLTNEPVIFLDGVRMNARNGGFPVGGQEPTRLNDVNPADVADIRVLRGPVATALYGSAGANGVVLVTTRRGRDGATRWNFFAETAALDDVADYPANFTSLTLLDRPDAGPVIFPNGRINGAATVYCPTVEAASGRCFQDELQSFNTAADPRTRLFSRGQRRRWGASVGGGTPDVRYYLSGRVEDETGVVRFNGRENISLRANLDARVSRTVDLATSFAYTDGNLSLPRNGATFLGAVIQGMLGYPSFVQGEDYVDGGRVDPWNYLAGFDLQDLSAVSVSQDVDRFLATGRARWRPTGWLTLRASGGLDFAAVHDFETIVDSPPVAAGRVLTERASRRSRTSHLTGTLSGTARIQPLPGLRSTTTLGAQYDGRTRRSTLCAGFFLTPGLRSCDAATRVFTVDEGFFQDRALGVFARQALAYGDRLFLDAAVRFDRASSFGDGVGAVAFPAVDAAWIVSEEAFFPTGEVVSSFRVRGGWGRAGTRPEPRQAWDLYTTVNVALPGGDAPGYRLATVGNAGLGPEVTTGVEFGADAALFDHRLAVGFTWFDQETEGVLLQVPAAPSLGLARCSSGFSGVQSCSTPTRWENRGRISNTGTELAVRLDLLRSGPVGLSLGFRNTTVNNEVLDRGPGGAAPTLNRGLQRLEAGYPAWGFWQEEVRWADANGDGLLGCPAVFTGNPASGCEVQVADEAGFIGPSLPTWQRSLSADLRLFDWITVSTLFEGRGGHYSANFSEALRCTFQARWGCRGAWDPSASLEDQAAHIADRYLGSAAGYVERADFWRWQELALALEAPRALSERVGALEGLRLTLAGRNLALLTDYPGLDPEIAESGGGGFAQGEFFNQAPVRLLTVRLDYSF